MTSKAEVEVGVQILRAAVEVFTERALAARSAAARDRAIHTIKKIFGLIDEAGQKRVWGRPKGNRTNPIDLQVLADVQRYGSVPKAVKAYMADGRLPHRAPKTHIDRINKLKREPRKKRSKVSSRSRSA